MTQSKLDQHSAERLILDHLPDIVTLCNRMFSQVSDAQDATNAAVLAILDALSGYRGDGPVRHWLLKVALNAARNHRRRLTRNRTREKSMSDQEFCAPVPENPLAEREQREALRLAIAALPDELREPIILHYYHKLTQTEIGQLLSCSQKTVHKRLSRGMSRLNQKLAGGAAFGSVLVATVIAEAALDPVTPSQAASVQSLIGSHYSSLAAATPVAGQTLGTTITTGGILMQTKIVTGAIILAASCFVGGAVLSSQVLSDEQERLALEEKHSQEMRALTDELTEERERLRLITQERDEQESQLARVRSDLETLQYDLRDKERALADLGGKLEALRSGRGEGDSQALSAEERWEKIQGILSGVLSTLEKMQQPGANQFELGPQLVAELAKLSTDQFQEILQFDATATDTEAIDMVRAVMLNAFIFVEDTGSFRDDYMERYLERAEDGEFGGGFSEHALRRVCYEMPPYVDAYAKIVEPLNEDLRESFLEVALDRTLSSSSNLRLDGARFLGRVDDARATRELQRIFSQSSNSQELRLEALKGLARRSKESVVQFLRSAQNAEADTQVLGELKKVLGEKQ